MLISFYYLLHLFLLLAAVLFHACDIGGFGSISPVGLFAFLKGANTHTHTHTHFPQHPAFLFLYFALDAGLHGSSMSDLALQRLVDYAFAAFDTDVDGLLTPAEFCEVCTPCLY